MTTNVNFSERHLRLRTTDDVWAVMKAIHILCLIGTSLSACTQSPETNTSASGSTPSIATAEQALNVGQIRISRALAYGDRVGPTPWLPSANSADPIAYQGYSFAGTAGDSVELAVDATGADNSYVWLLNAAGDTVAQSPFGKIQAKLPATGTYLIAIREGNFQATTFTVSLQGVAAPVVVVPPPPPPATPSAMTCQFVAITYFGGTTNDTVKIIREDKIAAIRVRYSPNSDRHTAKYPYLWFLEGVDGKSVQVPRTSTERIDWFVASADPDSTPLVPSVGNDRTDRVRLQQNWRENTVTVDFDARTGAASAEPGGGTRINRYRCNGTLPLTKTF
jgi:hypothetical protein